MIRAAPTYYKGLCFRSKLEADWARYFDSCDLQWSYECEHYQLSNRALYLPDFYLGELNIFVECRGNLERSLRKPALFLKESGYPLLIALPEGRFFLASLVDDETGEKCSRFVEALFNGYEDEFERFQKQLSCFVELDDDAEGSQRRYFANYGFSSPDYCGYAPDWINVISDRSRIGAPNSEARAIYFGGFSTWEQRGFTRHQHVPRR